MGRNDGGDDDPVGGPRGCLHARAHTRGGFAAAFAMLWAALGVVAFAVYEQLGLMDLGAAATVGVLVAAALYELTPPKRKFLRRCRANAYRGPAFARGARYGVD